MTATKTARKATPTKKPAAAKMPAKRAPRKPKEPTRTAEATMELSPLLLANLAKNALGATGKNQMRPILCGAMFQCEEGMGRVVSTDSYKLIVQEFPLEGAKPSASFIIPRDSLVLFDRLARALRKPMKGNRRRPAFTPANVKLHFAESKVAFEVDGTRVEVKLIAGDYPNWQNLVSEVPATLAVGNAGQSFAVSGEYLAAFGRLAPLNGTSGVLIVSPQADHLKPVRLEVKQSAGYRIYGLLMPVRTS